MIKIFSANARWLHNEGVTDIIDTGIKIRSSCTGCAPLIPMVWLDEFRGIGSRRYTIVNLTKFAGRFLPGVHVVTPGTIRENNKRFSGPWSMELSSELPAGGRYCPKNVDRDQRKRGSGAI